MNTLNGMGDKPTENQRKLQSKGHDPSEKKKKKVKKTVHRGTGVDSNKGEKRESLLKQTKTET